MLKDFHLTYYVAIDNIGLKKDKRSRSTFTWWSYAPSGRGKDLDKLF